LESEAALKIKSHIKGAKPEFKSTLIVEGVPKLLPIYKIPINLLKFNIENGRFVAEKIKYEKDEKITLNPDNSGHNKHFIKLLLADDDPDSTKLLEDLKKYGQRQPGVITHDGYVINGNRRMAALMKLDQEDPSSKYKYLLVHILSKNIAPHEVYKIEVDLQIRDKYIKDYNPINRLLKIKDGLNKGIGIKELSKITGIKEREIQKMDKRLKESRVS